MGSDRAVVKTYVPQEQKAVWREHADELDMSQSEFLRTMVQAGRRGFDGQATASRPDRRDGREPPNEKPDPAGSDPGGKPLETVVLDVLEDGHYTFDALLEEVTDEAERRLDETLQRLQADNRVAYSGRNGGYTLLDDE